MSSSLASRFRLQPDPPIAGRPVEVTYVGPATEIEWQADGGKPVKVKPGKNGKFTIRSVPSADSLMLTDNRGMSGYLHRKITHIG